MTAATSTNDACDVIVVGVGAMGSAAAFHLARRGARVVGIDTFAPPHAMGSSHGRTRIIREAYFEDPLYVPLVQRAYECWAELEALTDRKLLVQTGGLMIGPEDGEVVGGALKSARQYGLPHEIHTAAEVRRRFPAFEPAGGEVAVWEPRAGYLIPEDCVDAHLRLARRHGAQFRFDETVLSWRQDGEGVEIVTTRGRLRADRVIVTAGAWAGDLLSELRLPLTIERNYLCWFTPRRPTPVFAPDRFPIFIWEYAPGLSWYGFPDAGDGVKLALHHQGETTRADDVRRTVSDDEIERVRALQLRFLPGADGAVRETAVCMYTNTPDQNFIIDRHPAHPAIVVASPCSGHGFKFSSAIGEELANIALGQERRFDFSPFRLSRFS